MPRGSSYDFFNWAVRRGYQRFYQPRTVAPHLMNSYGWIDVPKQSADVIVPLYSLAPDQHKTMYWFYEKIVTMSQAPVRVALEGNIVWDAAKNRFDPAKWTITTGYAVTAGSGHRMTGMLIKTRPGEAMRLRIYPLQGASTDLYFKFIGVELPYLEE